VHWERPADEADPPVVEVDPLAGETSE
jgi:hypothetical protein